MLINVYTVFTCGTPVLACLVTVGVLVVVVVVVGVLVVGVVVVVVI